MMPNKGTPSCKRCGTQRTGSGGKCLKCGRESQAARRLANPAKIRESNRTYMARCRANPEKRARIAESAKLCYDSGGKVRTQKYYKEMRESYPFKWRARLFRASHNVTDVTEKGLADLWAKQGGRCALTGRIMKHGDVHLDHITPKSRGGDNNISNLRWVCAKANHAKRNLTDAEFYSLCCDVANWLVVQKGIET